MDPLIIHIFLYFRLQYANCVSHEVNFLTFGCLTSKSSEFEYKCLPMTRRSQEKMPQSTKNTANEFIRTANRDFFTHVDAVKDSVLISSIH